MLRLDGRNFVVGAQSLTQDQCEYIQQQLRLAGVSEVRDDLEGVTRTKKQRAEDMLTKILYAGRKSYILAGWLTEEGRTWSCADADANAARFGELTDTFEKAAMQTYIKEFVIGFFSEGE